MPEAFSIENNENNFSKLNEILTPYGGTINSEVDKEFDYIRGSVGLARSLKYNTEDSQFFIILEDKPLYEGEYTPIGKVIYGIEVLEKIKYLDKSEYVLRPDFINFLKMLK